MIKKSIFKAYDIRAIYPDDLNEETAFKIGQAFVGYTKAKKIVVGRDGRISSPELFKELTRGMIDQGADVYDIGQVPTEALYFSVGFYNYDAGIMITASHNPKEYNGFKMIKNNGSQIDMIPGEDMFEAVNNFNASDSKQGKIEETDIWPDYVKQVLSFGDMDNVKPFKIVIDASSGMAGKAISQIKDKLPVQITPLNFEIDGNFPIHSPNPLMKGSIDLISETITKEGADFGFIFDADGDRIFLIDEKGKFVNADIVLLLLAKYFLEKEPGTTIGYNLICSKAVPVFIEKWGGKSVKTKVGFINVRNAILKRNGAMGGELSGHYSFKDNFYLDSGIIAFLILLQVISESKKKVSQLVGELSIYVKSAEMNFEVKDKEKVLDGIKKKYSDGKQDYLDGVTVEYDNWWFNVRASQTEPVLRLTIEAETQELLEQKKSDLISQIE